MTVTLNKHKSIPLTVGTKTRLVSTTGGNWFPQPGHEPSITAAHKIGDEVVITEVVIDDNKTGSGVGYRFEGEGALWDSSWFEHVQPASPAPPPLIGSLSNDTSKAYARKARSRKLLTEEQNEVLLAASEGKEFDVYAFRKAATAALSAASTRAGQSMARRQWASEARHLLYWADALIDNHRLALPVYVGGKRSPRIAELEAEVAKLQAEGTPEIAKALRDAKRTIDDLNATVERQAEAHRATLEILNQNGAAFQRLNEEKAQVEAERDILASVIAYSLGLLTAEGQARLLGYWDGLEDA